MLMLPWHAGKQRKALQTLCAHGNGDSVFVKTWLAVHVSEQTGAAYGMSFGMDHPCNLMFVCPSASL